MKRIVRRTILLAHLPLLTFFVVTALSVIQAKAAVSFVIMPDSTNNRIATFNPFDGSLINSNLFDLQGGTQVSAIQVGEEIWVSEQVGDRISRWSSSGTLLGNIGGTFAGGGLDNIRGMAFIGGTVYVTNFGTANDAPGPAIVRISTTGAILGTSSTAMSPGPFAVISFDGGLLIASASANDDIHRYDLFGNSLGTFHNSENLSFAQQMAIAADGNVLGAGFGSNNIVRMDAATGDILSSFTASMARGVYQLGNGNILWSNSSGVHVYDVVNESSSLIYSGGGRHFSLFTVPEPVPEPAMLFSLGIGLAAIKMRRRRKVPCNTARHDL
jgi:hypothetical protein